MDSILFWKWLEANALTLVTIVVLIFTCCAAFVQANAATKLTEATDRQIKTGEEQAKAATQQVEVARRQITESLRPIITFRSATPNASGRTAQEWAVINEGTGVALDVWWFYGQPSMHSNPDMRNFIKTGLIPSKATRSFVVSERRAVEQGVTIVYGSISGQTSATTITWQQFQQNFVEKYSPDITDWAKKFYHQPLANASKAPHVTD
jgi:hypothetical protein